MLLRRPPPPPPPPASTVVVPIVACVDANATSSVMWTLDPPLAAARGWVVITEGGIVVMAGWFVFTDGRNVGGGGGLCAGGADQNSVSFSHENIALKALVPVDLRFLEDLRPV